MSKTPTVLSAALLAAAMFAAPAAAQEPTADAVVDGLNAIFGKHKVRSSHAKGFCVAGTFKPSADAAGLTKSASFAKEAPVIGRFSMGGGNPKVSDKAKAAARGFAVRLDPDGKSSDFVMISAPVFFAKNLEQVKSFLDARAPGADGKPDPEKVKAYSAANPETTKQGAWLNGKPVPASFASVNYWGIHAFTLTNAKGDAKVVKLKIIPTAGEQGLSDDDVKAKPDNFYQDEMKERLAKGPAQFDFVALLGEPGDPTADPTQMWPEESRKAVKLGTISITAMTDDAKCDGGIFDPTSLQDGIAGPKDDATFAFRSPAYAVSLSRRAN